MSTFEAGRFTIAGTDRSVDLAEVARAAHDPAHIPPGEEGGLVESGEFTPTAVTFPNGTHICEVEIDPETGVTEVVRYSAVEELGHVLNPMLVAGQTHGGVAQGVGQAMGEQIVHDPHSGQMLTASFMDYQMPRADDCRTSAWRRARCRPRSIRSAPRASARPARSARWRRR